MRISAEEKELFIAAVKALDPEARVWLFGSRVDDAQRGGDIDLAVLSGRIGREAKTLIRRRILDALGEQRLDLVVSPDGNDPFFRLAVSKGVRLDA